MANVNRWISGRNNSKNAMPVNAQSGTTVEMGDLMFLDDADGLREGGGSTANYSCYPLSWLRPTGTTLEAKIALVQARFLGVAMDDKDGHARSQEKLIPIVKTGMFEYDLKPGGTINVGTILAPTGTTSSSNILNQKVVKTTVVTKAIGYSVEKKVHATSIQMLIRPAFGLSNIIS